MTRLPALGLLAVLGAMGSGCAALRAAGPVDLPTEHYSSAEHNDFGVVYESNGDLENARREYRAAVSRDPAYAAAWTNLGNVLAQTGQPTEARDAYGRALAVAPGYAPAVNNLAMTYLEAPRPDPALAIRILEAHLPLITGSGREPLLETLAEAREELRSGGVEAAHP